MDHDGKFVRSIALRWTLLIFLAALLLGAYVEAVFFLLILLAFLTQFEKGWALATKLLAKFYPENFEDE